MKKKNERPARTDAPYPGLTLLSRHGTTLAASPETAKLETFRNANEGRDYTIIFDCPEFTSLCPVTGQPDFGHITISYVPKAACVESKSLKLYLFSYREHNSFHETAVNSILTDLVRACAPKWMEVRGDFRPRGGIAISVVATHGRRPRG